MENRLSTAQQWRSAARRVRLPSGRVFPPGTGDDKIIRKIIIRIRKTPNRVHASLSHVSREGHGDGEEGGRGIRRNKNKINKPRARARNKT